jgi:hypothetical protein
MNDIKYANFMILRELKNNLYDIKKETIGSVFAGMYTLTLLTKDGFAGVEELKKEYEADELEQVKKDVKRAILEKEETEKIRNIVKEALKSDDFS